MVNTGSSRSSLDGGFGGLCLGAQMGRNTLHPCTSRRVAFCCLPGNHYCAATCRRSVTDSGGNTGIVVCQRKGKPKWRGALANGSEVCRLKSVDNHGLAQPSPSGSFHCVVSFSSTFLLLFVRTVCRIAHVHKEHVDDFVSIDSFYSVVQLFCCLRLSSVWAAHSHTDTIHTSCYLLHNG